MRKTAVVKSYLTIILLIVVLLSLFACADYNKYLSEGNRRMQLGEFDGALTSFQNAILERPDSPEATAGMGMILSLRRVSQNAALRLLLNALKRRPEQILRRETLRLMLDMGLLKESEEILGAKWVPVEQVFGSELQLLRRGVACIRNPRAPHLQNMRKAVKTSLGKYFLVRCLIRAQARKEAFQVFSNIKDHQMRCELLAALPTNAFQAEKYSHQLELKKCRDLFPGSIPLHREPPLPIKANVSAQIRLLYPKDRRIPPYHSEREDWRYWNVREDYYERSVTRRRLESYEKERISGVKTPEYIPPVPVEKKESLKEGSGH